MQRAELVAELERLCGEAAASRARLAEIQNRIKLLREQLERDKAAPAEGGEPALKLHSV